MNPKRLRVKLRYVFLIAYLALIVAVLTLRNTPLNRCTPSGLIMVCFGIIDAFLSLMTLPGWWLWRLLPEAVSQASENAFTVPFKAMGVSESIADISLLLLLTGFLVLCLGYLLDRRRKT